MFNKVIGDMLIFKSMSKSKRSLSAEVICDSCLVIDGVGFSLCCVFRSWLIEETIDSNLAMDDCYG